MEVKNAKEEGKEDISINCNTCNNCNKPYMVYKDNERKGNQK